MQIKVGGTIKDVEIIRFNVDQAGSRKPEIRGLEPDAFISGVTFTDFTFLGRKITHPAQAGFIIDEKTVKNISFK
jgi:hypothetical protein